MRALRLITEYLEAAGHKEDLEGPLFRPVQNRVTGELRKPLHPVSVYQDMCDAMGRKRGSQLMYGGFASIRYAPHTWRGAVLLPKRRQGRRETRKGVLIDKPSSVRLQVYCDFIVFHLSPAAILYRKRCSQEGYYGTERHCSLHGCWRVLSQTSDEDELYYHFLLSTQPRHKIAPPAFEARSLWSSTAPCELRASLQCSQAYSGLTKRI